MESTYKIQFSDYFYEQIKEINDKKLIEDKLRLIEINPFRFKPLHGYRFVFAIKITLNGYWRLIYSIDTREKIVFVFGLFPRKNDYKDFMRFYERWKRKRE